jgi:hypothetical protein
MMRIVEYRGRLSILLFSLFLLLLVYPFFRNFGFGRLVLNILFSIVLLSSLYAVSDTKRRFRIALALWIPAFVGVWLSLWRDTGALGASPSLMLLIYCYLAFSILSHILKEEVVTSETIYGALSVYLLFGLIWAMLYFSLESLLPGSINFAESTSERILWDCVYYSYVTLTTLGYGDMTPVSAPARSLSFIEALLGQVYLAVLVARLVGLHIAHSKK